jgi:hypothetical protein
MIFAESLLAALILYLALSRNAISDYRIIIYVMSGFFIFSLISSFTVPYVLDDLDYLHDLAGAIDSHQVFGWLIAPANEHIIFLEKFLYLFCYKSFWLYPEFFHVVIVAVCLGNIVLIYRLIFILTQSSLSAFIGASIMASTNLTDEAIIIGANSLIFFSIFLLLLLFYAIYRYAESQKLFWRYAAFFIILLVPSSFASGLTSIIFAVLFYRLCLSRDLAQKAKNLFPLLLMGWLLSLIPYIYSMNSIIHAKHYHDIGVKSTFGAASFFPSVHILGEYVTLKLIPFLMTNLYLSFGLFFLCFFTAIKFSKEIVWKRILFFVSFGLINNFIIYVFRNKWGVYSLMASRYDAFPVIMMAFSYALILDVFLKQKRQINNITVIILVYVLCFFAVVNGCFTRYSNGNQVFKNTVIMQDFNFDFRKVFVDYFREHNHTQQLKLKNAEIAVPFSRNHWRSTNFYAQYILPSSIYKKIVWSKKTDPEFLQYLKSHQYYYLTDGE